MDYAGPLWIGSISDPAFIEQIIKENQNYRVQKQRKNNQTPNLNQKRSHVPATYYVIDKLSGKLNLPAPSNQAFLAALHKSGFQAVPTHFNPRGIKTDAPALTMHKLLREIVATK